MTTAAAPPAAPTTGAEQSLERRSWGDVIFRTAVTVAAAAVPVLLAFLVYELGLGSRLAIGRLGLGFATTRTWDPVAEQVGAMPLIVSTLLSSLLALVIAVPLSLGVSVYLTDVAPL